MTSRPPWDRVEAALDEILALPESDWPEASARIAGDDLELLAEINSLLACTGGEDPVLDGALTVASPAAPRPTGLAVGTRIGAYRIVELIGRGGMGEVYRAERADGQYEQEVALKLIRQELAEHPERFQAERQILAQLEHPGIARLLDGGVSDDGLPYMAIELVRGVSITEWCSSHRSDLAARLRLFMAVCDAVAHAHGALVVHRDIKPGNVLVTDAGDVKLLDFGVAKLLLAAPGDATRNAPMTPAYSAPEQLTGGAITTATDVYALGILLFELLCGELPWKGDSMPFGVAVRKILSETVPMPSRRARFIKDPPVPWNALRGDLDAILGKALRKEPEHRYANVIAMRDDVARVLRHEPVAAREGARLYVIGRFVRRQRLLVTVAGILFAGIVAALIGLTWQARVALREAQRAEGEGRKATAVKDFLLDIFKQSSAQNPGGVEARKLTAEQLLDVGTTRIKAQLRNQPEVREEIVDTLAELNNDLGLTDRAKVLASDNLEELQSRLGSRPSAALARLQVRLATTLIDRDEIGEANHLLHQAQDGYAAAGEFDSVDAAAAYLQLGRAAYNGTTAEKIAGVDNLRRALDILKRRDPANPLRGDVLSYLARFATLYEDDAGAERWLEESLAFQTAQGVERNAFAIGNAYSALGDYQSVHHRYDDAERNLRQGITLLSQAVGPQHPVAADARARLGELLFYMGHRLDAAALLTDALQAELSTPLGLVDATETRKTLSDLEFTRGRWTVAEQLLRENVQSMKGLPDKELRFGISASHLALVLAAEGDLQEARALHAASLDVVARYIGTKSRAYARALGRGGELAIAERKPEAAAAIFDQVLKDWVPASGQLPDEYTQAVLGLATADLDLGRVESARQHAAGLLQDIANSSNPGQFVEQEAQSRRLLGVALLRSGGAADAEAQLRRAVVLRQSLDDADSPWLAQARIDLARCLIAQRKTAEARTLLNLAAAAQRHQPKLRDSFRRDLTQASALLRKSV
ncbi:MAG: serine/threonine-protein kinase [Steroidobacteraceae bacterium]